LCAGNVAIFVEFASEFSVGFKGFLVLFLQIEMCAALPT